MAGSAFVGRAQLQFVYADLVLLFPHNFLLSKTVPAVIPRQSKQKTFLSLCNSPKPWTQAPSLAFSPFSSFPRPWHTILHSLNRADTLIQEQLPPLRFQRSDWLLRHLRYQSQRFNFLSTFLLGNKIHFFQSPHHTALFTQLIIRVRIT